MNQQLSQFQMQSQLVDENFYVDPCIFPIHPLNPYNDQQTLQPIDKLITSYYDSIWIKLQDEIHYGDQEQYLKRIYSKNEQNNKIKLLGDYYRYHFQAPRLFMSEISEIIEQNVQEKRGLQYALVTKQMQNGQNKQNENKMSTGRIQAKKKIIKDIELSYNNFQQKQWNKKSQKQKIDKKKVNSIKGVQKKKQISQKNNLSSKLERTKSISSQKGFFKFQKQNFQKNKKTQINKKSHQKQQQKTGNIKYRRQIIILDKKQDKNHLIKTKRSSVNSSVASNYKSTQTLSRSQSRAQLTTIRPLKNMIDSVHKQHKPLKNKQYKNKTLKTCTSQSKLNNKMHTTASSKIGSSKYSSAQNSIVKSSRKQTSSGKQAKQNIRKSQTTKNKLENIKNSIKYGLKQKPQDKFDDINSNFPKTKTKVSSSLKDNTNSMFNKAIQMRKHK